MGLGTLLTHKTRLCHQYKESPFLWVIGPIRLILCPSLISRQLVNVGKVNKKTPKSYYMDFRVYLVFYADMIINVSKFVAIIAQSSMSTTLKKSWVKNLILIKAKKKMFGCPPQLFLRWGGRAEKMFFFQIAVKHSPIRYWTMNHWDFYLLYHLILVLLQKRSVKNYFCNYLDIKIQNVRKKTPGISNKERFSFAQ